jgi:hypothetical protein
VEIFSQSPDGLHKPPLRGALAAHGQRVAGACVACALAKGGKALPFKMLK